MILYNFLVNTHSKGYTLLIKTYDPCTVIFGVLKKVKGS